MAEYTLLLIEATGIQDYVFGSNNLRQNIGASERVTQATRSWIFEILDDLKWSSNVSKQRFEFALNDQSIVRDGLQAEVIYAGGGNALLLCATPESAHDITRGLTRRALLDAPGLQLVASFDSVDWNNDILVDKIDSLRRSSARRKMDRAFSAPLVGMGVTAACDFTGLPAIDKDADGRLISAVVQGKLAAFDAGLKRLQNSIPKELRDDLEFVYDFDYFGRKDESSYIAVVHIDGNGIGKRIQNLGEPLKNSAKNTEYLQVLRKFSTSLRDAATLALQKTVKSLTDSRDEKGRFGGVVPMPIYGDEPQLPFRPIVFGGDDVTFVCEGRLGLTLAKKYLDEFSNQTLSDKEKAYARAGVAVVKSHFPFSRAYALAEELASSAKDYISYRQAPPHNEVGLTAIDWHFAVNGLLYQLGDLREREYTVRDGKLFMRPYRLSDPQEDPAHSWKTFEALTTKFKTSDAWADKHNKVIKLREALRSGTDATKQFIRTYGLDEGLPKRPGKGAMMTEGWEEDQCGYFDAIEAMEFFVPIK